MSQSEIYEHMPVMGTFFDKLFLEHPRNAGERYFEHLAFTLKIAGYLISTSLCIVIHGLVPHFHQTTTSRRIFALNNLFRIRARKPKSPG